MATQKDSQQNKLLEAFFSALSNQSQPAIHNPNVIPQDVGVRNSPASPSNPYGQTFYPNPSAIDLQRIVVPPPRTQASVMPQSIPIGYNPRTDSVGGAQLDERSPVALPAERQAQQPGSKSTDTRSPFMKFLTQLGIPLATTGIGMAVPGALAGAAGFQTGYTGELAKDREKERKKELVKQYSDAYTFNPDTGEYESTGVKIPKGAQVRNLTSQQKLDVAKDLFSQLGLSTEEVSAATKGLEKAKSISSDSKVKVMSKEGVEGFIPKSQLKEALNSGYSLI